MKSDQLCHICGKQTSSIAANPSVWPIHLAYPGANGKTRCYCTGCVIEKINAADPLGDLKVRVQLSEDIVQKLVAGQTIHFRLPRLKNLIQIVKGAKEEVFFGPEWDNLWKSFDKLFKNGSKLFSRLHK